MNGTEYLHAIYLAARPWLRPGTREQYAIATRSLDAFSGDVAVADWTVDLLNRWLGSLSGTAATINSKRRPVCTLWRHCDRRAPIDEVVVRPEPKRAPTAWTVDEIGRIRDVCRGQQGKVAGLPAADWWESLLLAVYDTGVRINAMLSLAAADCDLTEGWVLIRAEAQKVAADSVCGISAETVEAIMRHYDVDRPLIWPWPWHHNTLWARFRRIVEAAQVPCPRSKGFGLFHRLRRTTLSYCWAVDPGLAQRQADHSSQAVTKRHYVDPRLVINTARSAADVLPVPDI